MQLFVVQILFEISGLWLYGSHAALAYSRDCLTSVVYSAAFTFFGHACIFSSAYVTNTQYFF